jgi:hypothetical protein
MTSSTTPELGASKSPPPAIEYAQGNSEAELMPMATSSDLFVGELFGDELIDIYNAAVHETVERSLENGEISRFVSSCERRNVIMDCGTKTIAFCHLSQRYPYCQSRIWRERAEPRQPIAILVRGY